MYSLDYYLGVSKVKPLLIEFWSPGCAACQIIEPEVRELIKEISGKFMFIRLNAYDNMELASELNVYGLPTFFILKDGEIKERVNGANLEKVREIIKVIL